MTSRRAFVAEAVTLLAARFPAHAQQAEKVRQIGYLDPGSPSVSGTVPLIKAFEEGLRAHGWIVGQTLTIEYRWAEGKLDRLPALARELVGLKVEVISASTTAAVRAAMSASATMPIVGLYTADPVAAGLVASLARPGGNVTVVTDPRWSRRFSSSLSKPSREPPEWPCWAFQA
jgi:putative ABC transport system substrate-binding protein